MWLVCLLAGNLDRYELSMQINHAHRTLKNEDNSNCWPIFAQFVSWMEVYNVDEIKALQNSMLQESISQIDVSIELTRWHNSAFKQRKEMLQ